MRHTDRRRRKPGHLPACSDLKWPVMLHMDTVRTDEPGLPAWSAPPGGAGATFIGHATGWWSSISAVSDRKELGGYPTGPVKPGGASTG